MTGVGSLSAGKGSDPGSLEIAEGSEPFSDGKRIRPRCRPARILMTGVGSLSAGKGSDPGSLEIARGQSRFPTENGSDPDAGRLAL